MSANAAPLNAEAVLAHTANALVVVNTDHKVVVWNAAAELLFGWRSEEVVGGAAPNVPSELVAEYHAVLERVRSGGALSLVSRRLCRDGSSCTVRVDTSRVLEDGEIAGWVSVFHPIEDSSNVQDQMAERARLVRKLTDVVVDMSADFVLGSVFDRITQSLIELTGANAAGFVRIEGDELRLVSKIELGEHLENYTAPLETSLFGELLRSGKTVMLATDDTRSLDDLIWADLKGLHTIALGVSNVQGRPYGALYALYSKRRVGHLELELLELLAGHAGVALGNTMAYQEMARKRSHERAIVEASADGIAVLDVRGRVRKWNRVAAELTGRELGQALGKRPFFPVPYADSDPVTHQLPNGRWLEILSQEIPETGEWVVDFRDVTDAKVLEEEKDLFLATASHELRTPITVVQGFAHTLAQRWDQLDDSGRRSAVATIAERSRTLASLVNKLFLVSPIGAGEFPVEQSEFDLAAVLRKSTTAFESLSDIHHLDSEIPDDLPQAQGDPTATGVIVDQLLENAVKYSPEGGQILVRAQPDGDRVAVTVADNGVGIPPNDRERVFDRFFQGEAGDRRRFGGIGLGLYIARGLARAQGGDVNAHANEPKGTRMRLVLRRGPDNVAER